MVAEADEKESLLYAEIGENKLTNNNNLYFFKN